MAIIQKNFVLKLLSLVLALAGWSYFRFAANPIISAHFDQQVSVPITTIRLPVGYVAKYLEKAAVVTVAAPRRGEQPIKPDQVKAVLDLSNHVAGVYNIPITLVAPNLVVQSLSPASVTLTIEKIEAKPFTAEVHYLQSGRTVVSGPVTLSPKVLLVRGATSDLTHVAAVHVDVPIPTSPQHVDQMLRPIAVDAQGSEVPGTSVDPNLVRVTATFVEAKR